MRYIEFQEVGMENYGPYIEPMILRFEKDTLTLITGPNGIGKTMALDAIPFTFYGVTSKGARGDDVVNNKIGKDCKTWVKFKVNNESYIVTRYHKYTKLANTVIINQNGVDIKQGHKECLPLIERIVCPQKAFMNALMFGQKVKDFFTDLPDSQKKEIFRKVLDLEMFLIYYKFADLAFKDVTKKRHDISNKMQVNIGLLENTKKQLELLNTAKKNFHIQKEERVKEKKKFIEESTRLLNQWKEGLKRLQEKDINLQDTVIALADIEKSLKELAGLYSQKLKELDSRKQNKVLEIKNSAQGAISKIKDEHSALYTELQDKKSELKQKLSDLISQKQADRHKEELLENSLHIKSKELEGRIEEIQSSVINTDISVCPTCDQKVSEQTRKNLENKIVNYRQEIGDISNQVKIIQRKIVDINSELLTRSDQLNSDIKGIESEQKSVKVAEQVKQEEVLKKVDIALGKVESLAKQEQLSIIEESNEKSKDLMNQKVQLLEKKVEQEKNLEEIKKSEDNVSNIQYEIKQAERQISEIEESKYDEDQINSYLKQERDYVISIEKDKSELSNIDKLEEVVSFWKSGFSSSGIPSMLIDEAVPYMNERVEHYLDMLTNGRYIVSFDTLAETKSSGEFKDKISVHVLDTLTRANSRVQLSGGQTRIIDIAIILTLSDLLSRIQDVTFNIFLFDEIFDALDEQNIQYVSKVLTKIKIGKSIYIISHQHQDHLEADEVLAFT